MKVYRHGISIGLENRPATLTHEDYEELIPILEAALVTVKTPKIRVFIDAQSWRGRSCALTG